MSMNRSLGEGKITKITKRSAILVCERLGTVTFPINAANVSNNDCSDLREKYTQDEVLIFTAQKQSGGGDSNMKYVAASVVKRRELLSCSGKITECFEKFCYATVPKYGRVFIPYSARIETSQSIKSWLGKGAEINKVVNLKIFRQPDINNCRYVAWSLTLVESSTVPSFPTSLPSISSTTFGGSTTTMSRLPITTGQLRGAEKQPECAKQQLGVIVSCLTSGDCLIYSAQTGLTRIPSASKQKWMKMGRFVNYDAVKTATSDAKVNWLAKNVSDLGFLFEVTEDSVDKTKLLLNMKAVVNRVSISSRSGWLWNDFVGRIYIPPALFNRNLKPFSCLEIRAVYTGAFEDVPWSATCLKVLDANSFDEIRWDYSQLLFTDDNWTVKFIQSQPQTFYGFMDNPAYGSAFIAWTDLNDGDQPPPQLSRCRATVYYQQRDGKHAWRAVLVTQLDENGDPTTPHPNYSHTGKRIMPRPFIAPEMTTTKIAPPPGLAPIPNHWNMSATKKQETTNDNNMNNNNNVDRKMSTTGDTSSEQHSPPLGIDTRMSSTSSNHSIGVIGSGLPTNQSNPLALPPSPPASSDSPEPLGLASPEDRMIMDESVYEATIERIVANYTSLGLTAPAPSIWETDFLKWNPQQDLAAMSTSTTNSTAKSQASTTYSNKVTSFDFLAPFGSTPLDMAAFTDSLFTTKRDVATQTEEMREGHLLQEMMSSKELRNILMTKFPKYFDRIMDLKWN